MPQDLAADYANGLRIGVSVAQERSRLAAEQARVNQETQARTEVEQQNATLRQQQLATQKAYHDEEIGLRQQQLEQVQQANAAKTRQAALKMADTAGFYKDLQAGVPMEQAIYKHPLATTPDAAVSAHGSDVAAKTAAERIGLENRREARLSDEEAAKKNKPVVTGYDTQVDPVDPTITHRTNRYGNPMAPPPAAAAAPLPLPKTKAELKQDIPYTTIKGVYTWDGTNLVRQTAAPQSDVDPATEP